MEKAPKWYHTSTGTILLLIFFFPVGLYLMWKHTQWNRKLKYGITGFFALFVLLGMMSDDSSSKKTLADSSKSAQITQSISIAPTNSPTAAVEIAASSSAAQHNGVFARVERVVDGDTIKLETGETVRYIGIDTPETVDPRKPVQCYAKEASAKNNELVEGKIVELEKDISETDKYGRSLRYIWIDNVLINEYLVREGYAHSSSYPPDIKYQDRFIQAQKLAQQEGKGLWGKSCAVAAKPTTAPKAVVKQPVNTTTSQTSTGGGYACNCSKTCTQMSCSEAQYQLTSCGCNERDRDGDGRACDAQCN